jgi:hypothetical protein
MISASALDVRFPGGESTNVAMADFLAGLAKGRRAAGDVVRLCLLAFAILIGAARPAS